MREHVRDSTQRDEDVDDAFATVALVVASVKRARE